MNNRILAIFGASGQGKEVRDIAGYQNDVDNIWNTMIFVDDVKDEGYFKDLECLHLDTAINKYGDDLEFVIALGEPTSKKKVYERLIGMGLNLTNVISPDSQISKYAVLGKGLIVKKGAIISSDAVIGDNTTIQSYACVGHDAVIGKHCQISTHVDIGGATILGEGVFVGLNAPIREKINVGDYAIISAGAAVLRDIEPNVTVMGNPARVISRNNSDTKVFGR